MKNTKPNLIGTVRWFDKLRGEGLIRIKSTGISVPIYSCNLPGAKTLFPETACVYLKRDEEISIDHIHESCGAIVTSSDNIHFDAETWDRIKDQNLAFKCNDDGTTTGLFA
jgi:hypothetical protein